MENRWFPPKGDFHIWLLSKWRILLKQHDQRNLFLRYHYLAFTLVLRMRLTWVRKIPDLQTIQDRLPHSCMGPVTSYRLRWRGGGGRKRVRRRRGRRSEDFGVEWHAFQGDQVNYTVRQPNPPIPPHPPFPSGNKHDRFFNRKLWCVHRPLL